MDENDRIRCRKQLEVDEGREATMYKDSRGYWTIGVGRLIDPKKGAKLRESEIDFLFDNDCRGAEGELAATFPWFPRLNPARQAALVNMCFQLGLPTLLEFERTLRAIRDEHWEDARHHMMSSDWAKQTPHRARRVAHQMATGEWQ